MGAAKRRARARWSKSICPTCRYLGSEEEQRGSFAELPLTAAEISEYVKANPHSCVNDPGPQPKVELTRLEILIPRNVAAAINDLYELVVKQYPNRNDFLEDLLKEGLKSALQAQQAAMAQMQAEAAEAQADALAAQAAEIEPPLVELATVIPEGMAEASARLRLLRGDA